MLLGLEVNTKSVTHLTLLTLTGLCSKPKNQHLVQACAQVCGVSTDTTVLFDNTNCWLFSKVNTCSVAQVSIFCTKSCQQCTSDNGKDWCTLCSQTCKACIAIHIVVRHAALTSILMDCNPINPHLLQMLQCGVLSVLLKLDACNNNTRCISQQLSLRDPRFSCESCETSPPFLFCQRVNVCVWCVSLKWLCRHVSTQVCVSLIRRVYLECHCNVIVNPDAIFSRIWETQALKTLRQQPETQRMQVNVCVCLILHLSSKCQQGYMKSLASVQKIIHIAQQKHIWTVTREVGDRYNEC